MALAALAALQALSIGACTQQPRVKIVAPDGSSRATVSVEIAATDTKRDYGLMQRGHLNEDAGMIFVFRRPGHQQFWMKNTLIPLDMIFADSGGRIVGVVANAVPLSESIDAVDADSQYVLEVNGGFCERHGVVAGDVLRFEGFAPKAAE